MVESQSAIYQYPGMTLRDYFAGRALATLPYFWQADTKARVSYEMADAMLAERERTDAQ